MNFRLFCVVAHPDDECFAFGGALALAVDAGVAVHVLCLTDGQAATNRGSAQSGQELGAMRRREFAASCEVLGVEHEIWGYQDGHLVEHNLEELGGRLVGRMRELRPQVVVTFGAEGALNNHPDHTVVSAATTAAFHWSGNPKRFPDQCPPWRPERLFYLTTDFFLPERLEPLVAPWSCVLDITSVAERKRRAFEQHTSQAPLMDTARLVFEEHGREERYALAYSRQPQPVRMLSGFFAGLSTDPTHSV